MERVVRPWAKLKACFGCVFWVVEEGLEGGKQGGQRRKGKVGLEGRS